MRVRNLTRGHDLADRAVLADGYWSRLRGLLGRDDLRPGEGLVLVPCSSVHMFGMRFAVDVLHLDRAGIILRTVPALRPWRVGPIVRGSHTVVELPAGRLAESGTAVGDTIEIAPAG